MLVTMSVPADTPSNDTPTARDQRDTRRHPRPVVGGDRPGDPPLPADPRVLEDLELLTIADVCRRLQVNEKTVWKWIDTGLLALFVSPPPSRVFRVSVADLRRFIASNLRVAK